MQAGVDGAFELASNDVGFDFEMGVGVGMDPFGIDASLCFPAAF